MIPPRGQAEKLKTPSESGVAVNKETNQTFKAIDHLKVIANFTLAETPLFGSENLVSVIIVNCLIAVLVIDRQIINLRSISGVCEIC